MRGASSFRSLRPCISRSLSSVRNPHSTPSNSLLTTGIVGSNPRYLNRCHSTSANTERCSKLESAGALKWPRIQSDSNAVSIAKYLERYAELTPGEKRHQENVVVRGRVVSVRKAGGQLFFLDVEADGHSVQGVFEGKSIHSGSSSILQQFNEVFSVLRRGDIVALSGNPHRTKSGQLSVFGTDVPSILSPSLSIHPRELADSEARVRNRHVDMLVNPKVLQTLRLRSHVIQYIRNFLLEDNFLEVQTPIVAGDAGGAIAKPFITNATEFPEKQLALRIAPEIWLKRLLVGGMGSVFEIGPVFRNEGLDATHNPEYTTCEFYKSFANLDDLIKMTEDMVVGIGGLVNELHASPKKQFEAIPKVSEALLKSPFQRLEFVPTIEKQLGFKLPDLLSHTATEDLTAILNKNSISIPSSPDLPRLLDRLATAYIEPLCDGPTFVINHPACMAPLAKSYIDPSTKQLVSARAELYIEKKEIANMYEEENSPIEQREKFVQQAAFRSDENVATVDESYIGALEFGLPPTGGWGCGIDRLVMHFAGASRISDVLPFGSLRNVVNLVNPAPRTR
ncbi:hypothetical protein HYFRA_00002194 [Hymenoscyphus fraxineus]|uniref:Aminoacyl-transfer RNA synthetases class-II family profile domain-containing protein n=1 Tax=Hymenoscyphus fraxineus TaxID=746836 RepID=A0A9N9KN71_9HELO|nr:hypothetical protein HYFRA_00002194 [Hymenoscyphus fraxineus]